MSASAAARSAPILSVVASQRFLHLDFETCCEANLKQVGADIYARDLTLVVTVLAWAFDDEPVQSVICPATLPPEVEEHLRSGGRFKAWNAAFEWAILVNQYGFDLKPDQAVCTMQAGLHSGLPAAVGDAGPAIGAKIVKDDSARRLMLQMSRPRKILPDGARRYWHLEDPARLAELRRYCERDAESERGISKLIAPLPPTEAKIAALDRAANERGVRVDLVLIPALKALAKAEIKTLNVECSALTDGAVTSPGTQTKRLLDWFKARDVLIEDLSKESVAQALTLFGELIGPVSKRVLEIRQEVAKSSVKKLDAFQRCAGPDGRVRGQLAYYGAFRTGRFAGRLIQPQNFPRPSIRNVGSFIKHALGPGGPDPEWTRVAYGSPLEAIASSLRGCLIPDPGKAFVIYDLSQIEARVIAWLAGQTDVLSVFARGEDVYTYTQLRLGLSSRQAGKTTVLALGFQMGAEKFVNKAAKDGLTLTLEQSQTIVSGWREANPRIVDLWWSADRAVKELLGRFAGPTINARINDKLSAAVSRSKAGKSLLTLLLPGGRRLYYRSPRLEPGSKGWPEIVYSGVDQVTKRWGDVRTYGGKLVENCVQAIARDVLVEAALRVDALKLGELVLSVHDETVFEVPGTQAEARSKLIEIEINRRPAWAPDLPVASEGGVRGRYSK
jgi:DNA polymerase